MSVLEDDLLPVAPYVGRDEKGKPRIIGSTCGACGAVFLGRRSICARCAARNAMKEGPLAETGKLYNFTVVHRSLPGIKVPFVSATVDLDGGGNIRGNLEGLAHDQVRFDMPVKVVFEKAAQKDAKGRSYLSYHFEPA